MLRRNLGFLYVKIHLINGVLTCVVVDTTQSVGVESPNPFGRGNLAQMEYGANDAGSLQLSLIDSRCIRYKTRYGDGFNLSNVNRI